MRKIYILPITLTLCISAIAQEIDDFEQGFGPNNWLRRRTNDYGLELQKHWELAEDPFDPLQGFDSAISDRENISMGNTVAYWLASQAILINENDQLSFIGQQTIMGDQGSLFEVWVTNQTQTEWDSYEQIASWTESEFSSGPNETVEKVVPLGQFSGSLIHIAFVRRHTQTSAALGGDRWIIDEIALKNPLGNDAYKVDHFEVYPNPAANAWNVISKKSPIESIQVTDASGKTVLSLHPGSDKVTIDNALLANGVYFANILTATHSKKIALVKK